MIIKRPMKTLAIAFVGILSITGCSNTTSPAPETQASTSSKASKSPKASKSSEDSNCLVVKKPMLDAIADGSNQYKMTPNKGAAIKSGKYYYIAMSYKTETKSGDLLAENDVALWASTAIDGSGSIQSIDNMASSFTDWPKNVWGLSLTDDEASQAKKCLK